MFSVIQVLGKDWEGGFICCSDGLPASRGSCSMRLFLGPPLCGNTCCNSRARKPKYSVSMCSSNSLHMFISSAGSLHTLGRYPRTPCANGRQPTVRSMSSFNGLSLCIYRDEKLAQRAGSRVTRVGAFTSIVVQGNICNPCIRCKRTRCRIQ